MVFDLCAFVKKRKKNDEKAQPKTETKNDKTLNLLIQPALLMSLININHIRWHKLVATLGSEQKKQTSRDCFTKFPPK